jgi:hypothetical protein
MSRPFLGPEVRRRRQVTTCKTCRDRRVSIPLDIERGPGADLYNRSDAIARDLRACDA